MNDSLNFYSQLPSFELFSEQFDTRFQVDAPQDWFVIVADVKGSTLAVAEGRYKDVNVVGASCIIAVLNACKGADIPYVFGGDGASFLVPESLLHAVALALSGTRDMALESFGLELRLGAVPVSEVYENSLSIKVSKYQVSSSVYIAMFHGGGMAYADMRVKAEDGHQYSVPFDLKDHKSDFNGLECRWNPISTTKDSVVTLMVLSRKGDDVYRDVIKQIGDIYGVVQEYRPVKPDGLSLSFDSASLKQEAGVQTCGASFLKRILYGLKMRFENFLGTMLLFFNATAVGFEGRKYIDDVATNTDFQKFDDTLRIILDSAASQKKALVSYLEQRAEKGDLFYGISVSDATMMTCLIFERTENHVHFVDGNNGGYTMAARDMKQKMKEALEGCDD